MWYSTSNQTLFHALALINDKNYQADPEQEILDKAYIEIYDTVKKDKKVCRFTSQTETEEQYKDIIYRLETEGSYTVKSFCRHFQKKNKVVMTPNRDITIDISGW